MSIVLRWEDVTEPQAQGEFKKPGKGFPCSKEQLHTCRFGATVSLSTDNVQIPVYIIMIICVIFIGLAT